MVLDSEVALNDYVSTLAQPLDCECFVRCHSLTTLAASSGGALDEMHTEGIGKHSSQASIALAFVYLRKSLTDPTRPERAQEHSRAHAGNFALLCP